MKRYSLVLGLSAAALLAAPLSAQGRQDGPWWDPQNTGGRSGNAGRVNDGRVYDSRGGVYDSRRGDSRRVDGQWRRSGRDRNGNIVYVRTRYDSRSNIVREWARRDVIGRYRVFDRQVVRYANSRDRNGDGYEDGVWRGRGASGKNDRWDLNDGRNNGKHKGQRKSKNQRGRGR